MISFDLVVFVDHFSIRSIIYHRRTGLVPKWFYKSLYTINYDLFLKTTPLEKTSHKIVDNTQRNCIFTVFTLVRRYGYVK